MDDFEIKIGKVKQSPSLMVVKVLDLMKVHQVLAVNKDLNRKRRSMKVVSPGFQSADDDKEFLVIDVIVLLSRDE